MTIFERNEWRQIVGNTPVNYKLSKERIVQECQNFLNEN